MSKSQSQTYREKAAECVAVADKTVHPTERIELLKIAQAYSRLAEHLEELATLPLPEAPRSS
jgi:hypothetical protein